jgi:phage terminase large subunit-like protein
MMTGLSNDYSVCTTWLIAGSDYYLLDVFRGRLQYPDLRRKVVELARKHGVDTILIENVGPGMSLLRTFDVMTRAACLSRSGGSRRARKLSA